MIEGAEWDLEELYRQALTLFPVPEHINPETLAKHDTVEDIENTLIKGAIAAYDKVMSQIDDNEKMGQIERTRLLLAY